MIPVITFLQIGHWLMAEIHLWQQTKWPHGLMVTSRSLFRQTLQSNNSSALLISSNMYDSTLLSSSSLNFSLSSSIIKRFRSEAWLQFDLVSASSIFDSFGIRHFSKDSATSSISFSVMFRNSLTKLQSGKYHFSCSPQGSSVGSQLCTIPSQ